MVFSAFCVWATSGSLLFSSWQLVGVVGNGKIWGLGGQTQAGEYLEHFASADHYLCLNIAPAFANHFLPKGQGSCRMRHWEF